MRQTRPAISSHKVPGDLLIAKMVLYNFTDFITFKTNFPGMYYSSASVLSENIDQLKSVLETLSSTASGVGLQINWKKTKIMPIEKTASASPLTVVINGQAVDVVRQFTYLGSIISSNGTLDAEISARSAKANSVFGRLLRAVFHKPQISRLTKARIYNATVSSIMLYSSETWPITQTQLRKVDAIQTIHLRRVEGFKWYDKIRNTEIQRTFKLVNLSSHLEARSLRWQGHLLRLPTTTPARIISDFNPSIVWKRPRGRPRTRWADVINQRLFNRNIDPNEAPSLALDRAAWRRLTALSTSSLYAGDPADQER